MLAKEWLQSFERGGQVGPLQDQVLRRQHKFNGVRQWQLEPMTRLLPTLLLISVVFFFFGLIEFLIPLDDSAAGVIIAFSIVGGIFYIITTSAAAFWDACPYQTSVSKAIKYVFQEIVIPSIRRLGSWLARCLGSEESVTRLATFKGARRSDHETEILSAQAACWLLETTSSPKDQKMAVQNLIRLTPGVCSFLIHDWDTYERILKLAVEFIQTWQDKPEPDTVVAAQQFSAALLHLCVGYPRHATKWHMMKDHLSQIGVKAGEYHHGQRLSGCLDLCLSDSLATLRTSPAYIFASNDYSMKVVTLSKVILGDIPFWSLDREPAWSALWHVFEDKYDDTILGLMALAIAKGFPSPNNRPEEEVRGLVRNACSGKEIVAILLEGVRSGPTALSDKERISYIYALPIFTEILHRLGELPSTKEFIGLNPETLFYDVTRLILAVDGIYEVAHSVGASSELDKFMHEAQRLLRIFKPPVTRQRSMHIIFDGTLVSFVRSNQNAASVSTAAMQTFDWLNLCLSEHDFVTEDTISRIMWGMEQTELREEVLQLIYTYVSKWFWRVGEHKCRLWTSKGLISQILTALSSGAKTGSMDLMVPLALRHVIKRATSMSWELQDSEEAMRIGINVVKSVNSDAGTVGQAYSLLIFEVILSIWEVLSEECRTRLMSEEMVEATKRILLVIEELLGDGTVTLTAALRSKIGIMACPEPFDLSPIVLQRFLSDLKAKKPDTWADADLDTVVNRIDGLLLNGTTPKPQL
ncbi:hypothetical protein FRC01_004019 [Tulasnella sp. 417]|nr:hypothetical protein FRC01_004019 [Tulasnella sp. 417]